MTLIDAAGAFALLERVVAERGEDFTYSTLPNSAMCLYVHDTPDGSKVPGCGVGLAAAYAGVSLEELSKWDEYGVIGNVPQLIFDPHAVRVLTAFQANQDTAETYAVALAAAGSSLGETA